MKIPSQPQATAARATWALALFPPAIAASMAYTEGIALALAVGAGWAAWRGRFAWAGLATAAAALTRPTGALIAIPVAMLAWQAGRSGRVRRLALGLGPAVVALGVFLGWMAATRGSWTLPFRAQRAWDRGELGVGLVTTLPGQVADAFWEVVHGQARAAWTAVARDVAFALLYAVLLVMLWRREGGLRSPWVAYAVAVVVVPVSSGVVTSAARLGLLAYPLAWPAADWLGAREGRTRWAVAAAVLLTALMVAQLAIRSP